MRGIALTLAVLALSPLLALPAAAPADGPPYPITPPTSGAPYRDGPSGRYTLGGTWLLRPDPADAGISGGYWRDNPDTTGWNPVGVPYSFNQGDLSNASMTGSVAWYRRDFSLPTGGFPDGIGRREQFWIVRFESVNYRATVWLNGRQLGGHTGAYLPWELDLKGLRPGVNRLIVRVDDRRGPGDLPPGPGGGWWNWGGINREVLLRAVSRVDLPSVQVHPVLPCLRCAADVTVRATVRNLTGTGQPVTLSGRYGPAALRFAPVFVRPHATAAVSSTVVLPRPRLWAPANPFLYRVHLTAAGPGPNRSSRLALQKWSTLSGVRQIAVTPDGQLTLNGRRLNLRGFNIHEQTPGLNGVLSPERTNQLLDWIQGLGAKLIRAHYPLSPELQEQADRRGLLIWSEVPVYQVAIPNLVQPTTWNLARSYLRGNIATNANHPSVLLWSIGNELTTPADAGEAAYIRSAANLVHTLDPTRPAALAVSAWPGSGCQAAYTPLDVVGFNDYFGWFGAGGGTTDDRDQLSPFLDSLRSCYPTKALFVSEFGVEGSRNGPADERGTYAFQSDAAAYHLGVFASKPWLAGAIWFPLQDFAARPGWSGGDPVAHPPFVEKGMYDLTGNPKPVLSTVSGLYHQTHQVGPSPDR